MKLQQPIKWHGGKHYLAKKIIELMPPHTRYVEPFAGGLSVLLAKPCEGISEFANDLNGELINFWRTLARPTAFEQLRRMLEATPLSQWHFENTNDESHSLYAKDFGPNATRAYAFFVRARMSRQGLSKDYCTPTSRTRRGMNEQVSAWLSAIDGLPDIHERLKRVEVWNTPAVKAIKALDSSDTLFYCDPPYLHATRSSIGEYGDQEMTPQQHIELLECLASIRGKFLLSGYYSDLYYAFAQQHGWKIVEFQIPNNASSAKQKQRKIEIVWMNY